MKVLKVKMEDGSIFHAPAQALAEKRADYFATEMEGHPKDSEEWSKEVKYALDDETGQEDLLDYVSTNLEWGEIGAKMFSPAKAPDYSKQWVDSNIEIIDETIDQKEV